jgi:recombination protein RecR
MTKYVDVFGVPVGCELDYLDEGTLAAAIRSRTVF